MILQSINLHNFMSYADAYLDLNSINVACLSGSNGAGKSALLDATTWAIWEKGRASSDELIRLGQKEMWVELIFSHEGNTYRIRRSRQRTPSRSGNKANSKGSIDLQMLIPESGQLSSNNPNKNGHNGQDSHIIQFSPNNNGKNWKSLTASSITETQDKILQLLRMDYQTFINSAYLRQGAADQFARETPMKRKEILGEILSLSYFDRLQERCKERLKPLKEKCEFLNGLLSRLPEIEAQITLLESEQAILQTNLNNHRDTKEKLDADLAKLLRKEHDLNSWQDKQSSMQIQLQNLDSEIKHLNAQKDELHHRLNKLNSLVSNKVALEFEFAEYEATSSSLKDLEEKSFTAQSLEKQKIELRSKLSAQRGQLELELKQAQKELVDRSERKAKLIQDTHNREAIISEFQQYQDLINQEIYLSKQQETYAQFKQRIAELQTIIDEAQIRLSTEIEQKKDQLSQLKSLIISQDLLVKQKSDLEVKEMELDNKEKEFQYVSEKGQEIKAKIESLSQQINDKITCQQEYNNKIEELNKAADATICPLCSAEIVDRAAVIDRYKNHIKQIENEIISFQLEQEKLEKERNILRARYADLSTELNQRKALDMQKGQLNEKHRAVKEAQENQNKLAVEIESLEKQKEQNDYAIVQRTSLVKLSGELTELKFDPALYSSIQAQIRSQRGIDTRYHQLQKDLNEISKTDAALPELIKTIDASRIILAEESYGSETRSAITEIDKEWQQLNYDNVKHAELRDKLSILLPKVDEYKDLKRALNEIPIAEKNLNDTETWLLTKSAQQAELTKSYALASTSVSELSNLETEISNLKLQVKESQNILEALLQEEAKISANLESAKKELESFKDKNKELIDTRQAAEDFAYLAECFGKKGIQAIVIENAIPEIEMDANRLLSRLTDNKMHIGLITQQKNKSGNISETLDIVISDEIGTRNYELYSGGEAFKVNFAIRVALSRLLARRAGAKLETLIIDEGFGSQDDYSRDKLVKAIRSIQPDFARILVITHFADVKEMFPTHIQINKLSGISQIELIN